MLKETEIPTGRAHDQSTSSNNESSGIGHHVTASYSDIIGYRSGARRGSTEPVSYTLHSSEISTTENASSLDINSEDVLQDSSPLYKNESPMVIRVGKHKTPQPKSNISPLHNDKKEKISPLYKNQQTSSGNNPAGAFLGEVPLKQFSSSSRQPKLLSDAELTRIMVIQNQNNAGVFLE